MKKKNSVGVEIDGKKASFVSGGMPDSVAMNSEKREEWQKKYSALVPNQLDNSATPRH